MSSAPSFALHFRELRADDSKLGSIEMPAVDVLGGDEGGWVLAKEFFEGRLYALLKVARKQGADPAFWFASLEPVAVSDCIVERLDGNEWKARGALPE